MERVVNTTKATMTEKVHQTQMNTMLKWKELKLKKRKMHKINQ